MKFKLRSGIVDPESSDLMTLSGKEKEEQNNKPSVETQPENGILAAVMKAKSSPQKKIFADIDIDKKKESLIRNFYDSRKHKRSFTKIKG